MAASLPGLPIGDAFEHALVDELGQPLAERVFAERRGEPVAAG